MLEQHRYIANLQYLSECCGTLSRSPRKMSDDADQITSHSPPLDTGRLFTAGFGATGRSPSKDGEPLHLGQVEGIPPLSLIAASNDAIMVVSKCRKRVFTWGLDSNGGVLGIGTWSESSEPHHDVIRRVTHPVEIDVRRHLPLIAQIESVALGGDHSWILVEDGIEPRGVWRGGSAAVVSL